MIPFPHQFTHHHRKAEAQTAVPEAGSWLPNHPQEDTKPSTLGIARERMQLNT